MRPFALGPSTSMKASAKPSSSFMTRPVLVPSTSSRPDPTVHAVSEGCSKNVALWPTKLPENIPKPKISKSDQAFVKENLEFVWGHEGMDLNELNDLFEKVGFPRRDPAKLALALEHTHKVIWVRSLKQSRVARLGQLIGFARATSDGVLAATVWDVAVLPQWQRGGLGRAMMERLVCSLVDDGISTITLYAEPNVVKMYERLGFKKDPEGIRGIAFLRKKSKITV